MRYVDLSVAALAESACPPLDSNLVAVKIATRDPLCSDGNGWRGCGGSEHLK